MGGTLSVVALVGLVCCGASDAEGSKSRNAGAGAAGPCVGPGCGAGTGGSSGIADPAGMPPREEEVESSFRSPVAVGRFVWTANPESGRVALIDAVSFEIRIQAAGFGPTHLAALPGATSRAIVLNVLSHDATVLWVDQRNRIQTTRVDVHPGANSWAVGRAGRFAIAWTDASKVEKADPTEGFQDITVIALGESAAGTSARATRLSVGYRPTRLFIRDDERQAYAVTEPAVSVIDLAGSDPSVIRDVQVTDNPLENPASRDVTITPSGGHAIVRRDGSAEVGVVSLETGERVSVKLSGPVTDLDLTEDGSQAIAVVRDPGADDGPDAGSDAGADAARDAMLDTSDAETGVDGAGTAPPRITNSEVFLLPVPGIFGSPAGFDRVTITGETAGSVVIASKGGVALLYTNAFQNDHLTLLTITPGTDYLDYRTVALKAPVRAVFPTPDGAHAVALLDPGAGSVKAGAFSIVPIKTDLPPKIQGTEAPPIAVATADTGDRAILTVRDDVKRIHGVYLIRMPELQVDRFDLSSPPLATGIVSGARSGFIAQEHPEGRITFIELEAGKTRTLTGFELAAKVVDGSDP